jgi:hypothetical protein
MGVHAAIGTLQAEIFARIVMNAFVALYGDGHRYYSAAPMFEF